MEVLEAIGCTFIYLVGASKEKEEEFLKNIKSLLGGNKWSVYRENALIIKVESIKWGVEEGKEQVDFEEGLKRIGCRCGKEHVDNKSVLRQPSENWDEMIEMWSCHKREFDKLSERVISPRSEGILYADLFIIIERNRLSCSCINREEGDSGENIEKIFLISLHTHLNTKT